VTFVSDVQTVPLSKVGPVIERHSHFPQGTNVEFVQVIDRSSVRMRVWERSVGATNACGSGSCATVVAGVLNGLVDDRCDVIQPGGTLNVHFDQQTSRVTMTGPAQYAFRGEVDMRQLMS
jgi:diaminopimelate epimerase